MSLAREAFAQAVRLDPQDVNSQEQLCLLGGSEAAGDSESAVGGDPTALALRGGDVAGAIGSMFSDPGAFSTMVRRLVSARQQSSQFQWRPSQLDHTRYSLPLLLCPC